MKKRNASLAAVACLAALGSTASPADAATGQAVRDALADGAAYLQNQQQANGTFAGFGGNTAYSALAATGVHPADAATNGGTSAQQALTNSLLTAAFTAPSNPNGDSAGRPGNFERAILEAEAAGLDSSRVAPNQNLVAQLAAYYNDGGYFNIAPTTANPERRSTNFAAFGLLALARVNAPSFLLDQGVRTVEENQHNDGGWDFGLANTAALRAEPSGIDLTGASLAALCSAGVSNTNPTVRAGVNFLESQLGPDGGLGSFPNVSSNAWAVSGLNACDIDPQSPRFTGTQGTLVDYILDQQNADGGFFSTFFADPNNPNAPIASEVYSTQDALRPLGGESFSAAPPARVNPADPRTVTPDAVADGTSVPIALAVDDGSGGVSFCRVSVPSGSSLATLLATAASSSSPAGCATGGEFTGGQLSKLNGQTGTWAFSTGGGEQVATNQTVRFGDFVALRRTSNAVPAAPSGTTTPPVAVPAAVQARTTPTGVASSSLKVSAKKRVVSVSLSCARDNRSCEGKVFILLGKSTLGRREFTIAGGKTTKLNVKLSKSAMKRFGKKKRTVRVNTFSRDGAGLASTSSRTVTLTPTK